MQIRFSQARRLTRQPNRQDQSIKSPDNMLPIISEKSTSQQVNGAAHHTVAVVTVAYDRTVF